MNKDLQFPINLVIFAERVMNKDMQNFEEYIRQGEPAQREKASYWQTAIGLQDVDGLKPSAYLLDTARQHIEGDIDIDEVQQLIKTYYHSKADRTADVDDQEEADRAATNITRILSRRTLAFNTNGYIALHRNIFDGVFKYAGELRPYDITKKEWVLGGDTVNYLNFEDLRRAIDYDLELERQFSYKGLTLDKQIEHIAHFVSSLWQIHPFREGNTRTTAVFAIQYLRSIGFSEINNDMFARHSWYFRNALVRANYKNAQRGIDYDFSFLIKFFRNLLMDEKNELKNRYLHLEYKEAEEVQSATKVQSDTLKCKNCTLGELALLNVIKANPRITQKEMAAHIGKSERTVKTMTVSLTERGIIIRRNGKRNGFWEIMQE